MALSWLIPISFASLGYPLGIHRVAILGIVEMELYFSILYASKYDGQKLCQETYISHVKESGVD